MTSLREAANMSILADFTNQAADCQTPAEVLDTLDNLTSSYLPLFGVGCSPHSAQAFWLALHAARDRCLPALLCPRGLVGRACRDGITHRVQSNGE